MEDHGKQALNMTLFSKNGMVLIQGVKIFMGWHFHTGLFFYFILNYININ